MAKLFTIPVRPTLPERKNVTPIRATWKVSGCWWKP